MKKTLLAAAFAFAALLLAGCQGKTDKFGFYDDLEAAKTVAQKENKNILFTVTVADSDEKSGALLSNVLKTDAFKNYAKKSLICVNMDFSEENYKGAMVDENASKSKQKAAEKIRAKYEKAMTTVSMFAIEQTPTVLLLSKEGYVISVINCDDSVAKPEDIITLIDAEASNIEAFKTMLAATKTGSEIEQANAIDVLYESTQPQFKLLLNDLIYRFLDLDKANKTGKASKYLIASANIEAHNAYVAGNIDGTIAAFSKIADSDLASADDKQQAYYTAAYILMQTGSNDINRMIDLTQKAYDIAPESDAAQEIKMTLLMLQNVAAQQAAEAAGKPAN